MAPNSGALQGSSEPWTYSHQTPPWTTSPPTPTPTPRHFGLSTSNLKLITFPGKPLFGGHSGVTPPTASIRQIPNLSLPFRSPSLFRVTFYQDLPVLPAARWPTRLPLSSMRFRLFHHLIP